MAILLIPDQRHSKRVDWKLMRQGSTLNEVLIETVRELCVPVLPVGEQDAISEFVGKHTSSFNALIADAGHAVSLLRERRAALISAAVTGKIDVRDTVPAISDAA